MKRFIKISVTAILAVSLLIISCMTCFAATKNIKISMFKSDPIAYSKTTYGYSGSSDTPEGLCVVGNVIYTTKLHQDVHKVTIIKTVLENNGKVKTIMPAKMLSLGHGNDMTF